MDAMENLLHRRSCRSYTSEMPPRALIEQVVEAGTYAATGRGLQSPLILAVTNKALRDRLSAMNAAVMGADNDPFYGAPVVLVVLADKSVGTHVYDGACVLQQLLLAAHAVGLGSCWIHRAQQEFDSEEGKAILRELGIQGEYVGIGHCILGYSTGDERPAAPRKEGYVRWVE